MKTCTKCVIPETAESNKFDFNGTCSVCKQIDYKKKKLIGLKKKRFG